MMSDEYLVISPPVQTGNSVQESFPYAVLLVNFTSFVVIKAFKDEDCVLR